MEVIKKYAVELNPSVLRQEGPHKLICLNNGQQTLSFIRGKDNLILEDGKLTVLFSDLNKPVKLLDHGNRFKSGPLPSQIIQDFNLQLFEVEVEAPKPKQNFTPEQRINHSINSLQNLINDLPPAVNINTFQNTIEELKLLKDRLVYQSERPTSPGQRPPVARAGVSSPGQRPSVARADFSSQFFRGEVQTGIWLKRR